MLKPTLALPWVVGKDSLETEQIKKGELSDGRSILAKATAEQSTNLPHQTPYNALLSYPITLLAKKLQYGRLLTRIISEEQSFLPVLQCLSSRCAVTQFLSLSLCLAGHQEGWKAVTYIVI